MVTGADDPKMAENAIQLGAFGYLTKPFRPNELMINIVNALHRRRLELENRAHRVMLENAVEVRTVGAQRGRLTPAALRAGAAHAPGGDGSPSLEHGRAARSRDGTPSEAHEQLLRVAR